MTPDKTYHPREVLRNQEKNRKQKYSAQTTGKTEDKSKNFNQ